MTGSSIKVTLNDKAFEASVAQLGGVLRTGVVRAIGVALVEQTNKRFDSGTDPTGKKWQALLPAYAMIKKGPGILRASLNLQRSVTFAASGNQVTVGSNRISAAVHQFGATIKSKNGKGLAFVLGFAGPRGPRGGKSKTLYTFVRVQSVRIPARPYLGFGKQDQQAVMDVLGVFIGRAFSS